MLLLFTFPCKLYKKRYNGGIRVKMTREPDRVEIKVTELFTHHRMLQCFSCVSDQSVAEVNKTNQVIFSRTAVPLISLSSISSKRKQNKPGGVLADWREIIKVLPMTGPRILSVLRPRVCVILLKRL